MVQVHRFVNGDEHVRRRKLEVILQLGIDQEALSFLGRFFLRWLSFMLRVTVRRRGHVPQPASSTDRTCLPALNLSDYGATYHFGGALQTSSKLPRNYVASTFHMESRRNNNFVTRMLLSYIEVGGFSRNVSDFTFILAGEGDSELPERALCTSRTVHSTMNTLPLSCVSLRDDARVFEIKAMESTRANQGLASLVVKIFVADTLVATASSVVRLLQKMRHGSTRESSTHALLNQSPKAVKKRAKACFDDCATEPFQKAVNEVVLILEDIRVPVRKDDVYDVNAPGITKYDAAVPVGGSVVSAIPIAQPREVDFAQISILRTVTRHDILRYFIASNCSLKTTSVRLVESAVWRALTFPVDTRTCRIELQSGQFFQQGKDLDDNPVFYFRNTCLGPWRKDDDAVIAAVLHRLESSLNELTKGNPGVQCTLIVVMGKPYMSKNKTQKQVDVPVGSKADIRKEKENYREQATVTSTTLSTLHEERDAESDEDDDQATLQEQNDDFDEAFRLAQADNPRIYSDELWNTHTSKSLIDKILEILLTHYPERLSKALVVIGHGNKKYVRSAISGVLQLAGLIRSSRTRDKVRFLTRYRDLQTYVDRSQLVTLVGGTQVEDTRHFECN